MLERLRGAVKSWVAQVLLGLLVVSFAIWGMGDIAGGFSTKVATVGEREIEADLFATVLRREQQRYGVDPSEIRATGLDRFVLGQMVREAAFDDQMRALGVSAPDAAVAQEVRSDPAFQVGGQFDPAQYAAAVRRAYRSVGAYEETVRRALASAQLMAAATAGAVGPVGAGEALARQALQTRRFDAVTLTAEAHAPAPSEPDDAALQAHLDANAAAFARPETRDATFLLVDPTELAEGLEIAEDELRALYDARAAFYVSPETREIDQIVFAAEAEATQARARLDAGEIDFDGLLAERALSRDDAALGAVTRADLRDARADAAFALDGPGAAGPVPTATGFALLDVTAIAPEVRIPFEEVREDLRREIGAERAAPDADRLAEQIEDLRAGGATLQEVAAELGLTLRKVAGATMAGGAEGAPGAPEFLAELFAAAPGAERDLVRLASGGYLALRTDAVAPAATPALAEIRDAVAADWRRAARRAALAERAAAALERLREGESLAKLAEEFDVAVATLGPLRRDDPDPRLGPDARETLFKAAPGAAALTVSGDRATLAVLAEVTDPADVSAQAAQIDAAFARSVAQDQLDFLGRALEQAAGASINPQAVDAVISGIGG